MIVKKNVQSSNLTFKQLEVNVDTVFYRFNERKWIEEDEETKEEVHVGWIYDEIWYDKNDYIEKISQENKDLKMELTTSNMELLNTISTLEKYNKVTQAQLMMEVAKTIEGLKGGEA